MRLRQLDAQLVATGERLEAGYGMRHVATMAEAQGVLFQCPSCAEGKPRQETYVEGAHYILVWFGNPRSGAVPADATPLPRWTASGDSLDNLTLQPSVDCSQAAGCTFHGHVENGEARSV